MYSTPPQYHVRGAAINLLLKGYLLKKVGCKEKLTPDIYTITEVAHKENQPALHHS